MEWLKDNLDVGTASLLVAIAAFVWAIYATFRRKPHPKLVYQTTGVQLIGQHGALPEEATVTYSGAQVRGLTTSMIAVWNDGNAILQGTSIPAKDKLRLVFGDDANILKVELLKVSRPGIGFQATATADGIGRVDIAFDFLDRSDGAVIRVLHTGSVVHATMSGTIMGQPKGCVDVGMLQLPDKDDQPTSFMWRLARKANWPRTLFTLAGLALSLATLSELLPSVTIALFPSAGEPREPEYVAGDISWISVILAAPMAVGAFAIGRYFRRLPAKLVPEN
jgi:hypothetical protein